MTDDTMIERVARAICAADCTPSTSIDEHWRAYIPHARAAIRRMTAPTRPMLTRGVVALVDLELDGPDGVGPSDAMEVWQRMITASLSGSETGDGS